MDWAEKVTLYKEALNSLVTGTKSRTDRDEKIHDASKDVHGIISQKSKPKPKKPFKDAHGLLNQDYGAGFDGTTELDDKYRKETPGQSSTLKKVKKVVTEKLRSYKRVKRRKLYGSPRPGEDETLKRHINPQKAATHGERRADRNLAKTLPKD